MGVGGVKTAECLGLGIEMGILRHSRTDLANRRWKSNVDERFASR